MHDITNICSAHTNIIFYEYACTTSQIYVLLSNISRTYICDVVHAYSSQILYSAEHNICDVVHAYIKHYILSSNIYFDVVHAYSSKHYISEQNIYL